MTLTSDRVLFKSVRLKNENSSCKKKSVEKNEEFSIIRNNEREILGQQKFLKPSFCPSFQKRIAYEMFENSRSKCKFMDIFPTNTSQETSKGAQKFVKQISQLMEKDYHPFRDLNLSKESKSPKRLFSAHEEVKIKQKPKLNNNDRNYKKPMNKPDEKPEKPKQKISPIKIIKKSSAASNCSSVTRPRRGITNQLPNNFDDNSYSVKSIPTRTNVASHSNAIENFDASEPNQSKTRIKKLKRSEIPLRKILPNALNKYKPVSVSFLMEKPLEEVESDVSIDCYQSDNLSMITKWSNDERSFKEIDINFENENTLKSDSKIEEDAQLTRTVKTPNIPLNSNVSSYELSEKVSVSVCKSKKFNLEGAKSSVSTSSKTNSIYFQRLELLHQQTVSKKEKINSSVTSSELPELGSKSSFPSVISKKFKKISTQYQQHKDTDLSSNKSSLKIKNKKGEKEAKEKPNLLQKKSQVGSKSKILPEKLLNKNEKQLTVHKELKASVSKSSAQIKNSFTIKEDSPKRKNNIRETESIKKSQDSKNNKKVGLKSRDIFKKSVESGVNLTTKKSVESSVNLTTLKDGFDALKTEIKEEQPSHLSFKEDLEESERADQLLQLLISQIPVTPTAPDDYLKYREIMNIFGEIKSSSTLPLDFFDINPSSVSKEAKKLPQSRNKFSAKGKPKKVKSDKIDLQEEMEKLSQPKNCQMQIIKIETEIISDADKDNMRMIVDNTTEEAFKGIAGDSITSEKELKNLSSVSVGCLLKPCSHVICDQKEHKQELTNINEKEKKIDKNLEESSQLENSNEVKKSLADAIRKTSSKYLNNSKVTLVDSKNIFEKKKFFSPKGHFGSATTVKIKNKKQKPETKLRRNIAKSFDKVEKDLNDLFEEVVAVKLKRRNSEPSSFKDFVRKTADPIIPKSDKTSVLSLCSSLRHLNTDELEDFRVWETVPTKMRSCWEVSLYHFRRPWSVLSCSVFKDNRRASTPGIILENLRNGGTLEPRRSTVSEKSKVITPKEASFDVEPSIAQKNMDIRNWLAALNFPPPPSISNDVLTDVNCGSLPITSSSQSKVISLEKRKISKGTKYSEEALSTKFSKNPENVRKWSWDLPKSKELVRRQSGGYVAVSRESEIHMPFMKQTLVKTQTKPKKEKVVKNEIIIKKSVSVLCCQDKEEIPLEKVACGIQVDESNFEQFSSDENIIKIQEPEVAENNFIKVKVKVKEITDDGVESFNIWKYLFFISLSIIIYNFFSRNSMS